VAARYQAGALEWGNSTRLSPLFELPAFRI